MAIIFLLIGTGIINGTGNALNNTLNGNAAANSLNGLAGNDVINGGSGNDIVIGGAGKDNLIGGLGNDTYYIDNIGDVVTESSGDSLTCRRRNSRWCATRQ